MSEIITLLGKIYPLYILIGVGFLLGRQWHSGRKPLSLLIIYILGPIVIFHGAATANDGNNYLTVPLLFYGLCATISAISLGIGHKLWKGTHKDKAELLAFMGGTGNMGSFGIPLVLAFFNEAMVSVAIYSAMANIVFENTLGYYLLVKRRASFSQAARKVLALPAIYAFGLGIFLNLNNHQLPVSFEPTFSAIRLSLIVSGMLLIGMSLAAVSRAKLDPVFTGAAFLIKFLIFPTAMWSVLVLEKTFIHVFDNETSRVLALLSVMPVGSNLIAFATKLDKRPELVGFTVLATTLFALLYIPVFAAVFL
jgi:hypothetical protein